MILVIQCCTGATSDSEGIICYQNNIEYLLVSKKRFPFKNCKEYLTCQPFLGTGKSAHFNVLVTQSFNTLY